MENKTLGVDSVSAGKRTFVDVNNEERELKLRIFFDSILGDNEERGLKLRKTQSDIDAEDDKIWAQNLKPGTLMRVRKTVQIEELRKNTLIDGDVKTNVMKHKTMDYEWNLTNKNIVLQKDNLCTITAIYIRNNVGIFADLICFCTVNGFVKMFMLQKVRLDHTKKDFRFFERTDDVLKLNLVTEDHSWGKEIRIRTDEDHFSLNVNDCDETWNVLSMRLEMNDAGEITGIDYSF